MDWFRIIATIVLLGWGVFALVSGIRNDGKSRFLIIGIDHMFDNKKYEPTFIRIKNIVLGLLSIMLSVGILLDLLKND
ncbi:MAG TPA: hypothetical protein DHV26_07905 [Cytophagales bacterium]|nr:hypothetical protein [Cytophagales bacterium]